MSEAAADGRGRLGIDRRVVTASALAALSSLAGGPASWSERLVGAPPQRGRGGVYRGMVWSSVNGIAATYRMPAGGWSDGCTEPSCVPDGPVAEVTLRYIDYSTPVSYPAATRIVIVNELLRDLKLPDADVVVSAAQGDMNTLAEAFLRLLDRDGLTAVDVSDLKAMAAAADGQTHQLAICDTRQARAVCLDGVPRDSLVPSAQTALRMLGERGYDGGLCVTALVSPGDMTSFTHEAFDAFLTGTMAGRSERATLRMIATEASRSRIALVAFQ